MSGYNLKKAVVDLGFINGYFYANEPGEMLMHVLGRIESLALRGFHETEEDRNVSVSFLHELGCIRGIVWNTPIPNEVSFAMQRVIEFFTSYPELPCDAFSPDRCEPLEELLSDQQRDAILTEVDSGGDSLNHEFAASIGAAPEGIAQFWGTQGAFTPDEVRDIKSNFNTMTDQPVTSPIGKPVESPIHVPEIAADGQIFDPQKSVQPSQALAVADQPKSGRSEWTPEKRAAAAERAKGRKKPPFEEDLPSVKADFEAGFSFGAISRKWGCSDQHIRNFLTKHGIDPRRGGPGVRNGGSPPLSDEDRQIIIDEKAKGTPSKVIGEMIGRSQHAVDQKYSDLKKVGLVPEEHLTAEFLEKKKRLQNELVSEKMKEIHAAKRGVVTESADEPDIDEPAPTESIPSPASQWKASPLTDDDWGDIQTLLAKGHSRESIASDYDVPVEDLDEFIEGKLEAARQRRAAKGSAPGEARAPFRD